MKKNKKCLSNKISKIPYFTNKQKLYLITFVVFFLLICFKASFSYLKKEIYGTNVTLEVGKIEYILTCEELNSNNQIIISPNQKKVLPIVLTSTFKNTSRYELYYKIIDGSDGSVEGGHLTGHYNDKIGIFEKNETRQIGLYLENMSNEEITIEIGVKTGLINNDILLNENEFSLNKIVQYNEGFYITDFTTDNNDNITINYSHQTLVNSKINLDGEKTSEITYAITVFNDTASEYIFLGVHYNKNIYSNNNIVFELENLENEDVVLSGEKLTFNIKFKYDDETIFPLDDNILQSYLEFKFEPTEIKETLSGIEFNYLVKNGKYAPEGDVEEYYNKDANRLKDYTIKKIIFGATDKYKEDVKSLTAEPIDLYRTGSINLYRELTSDNKYIIYILSETGQFILNENSSWMFDKMYELEEIVNLHLLDTSNVIKMRDMFCDCAKLKNVDLSNFDTSKVINMIGMFARMYKIEYLDLTTFDTSNVEKIGQMFSDDKMLKKIYVSDKWDVLNKVLVEEGKSVFSNCTSLIGGNGTVLDTSKIAHTMAQVDTSTSPGYLTGDYKLNTGIEVNHVIKNKSDEEIASWTLENRYSDTEVTSITFGKFKDYYEVVKDYTGIAVDNDKSGVIKAYRIPNNSGYSVYILSNNGIFVANQNSDWLFDNLKFLKQINNLTLLDTSKVTSMRDMFCDCQYLTSLDLSKFNTYNVTSFEGMFARMYTIEIIDLSSFDTKNLVNIKNMFVNSITSETHESLINIIPKLQTIYVSNKWNIANVDKTVGVFANTQNLVGGNGTTFNANKLTGAYAIVDTDSTPGYLSLKQ